MSHFSDINKAFNNSSQNQFEYNSVIIKPPERNKTHGTITKTLVIDSRDRDKKKYPYSNKYRVEITEEYRDVTSLELVYGQIPNSYYNIKKSNNNFYISENDNIQCVEIPEGSYTNQSLIETLNGKQGNLFKNFNNKFNFSQMENSLKLRIQSNNNFIFNANYELGDNCQSSILKSIDNLLGFSNKTYISEVIDLSFVYVEPNNNIIYLNKKSENGYKLYSIKANSSNGQNLDFKTIFVKGDYIILQGGNIKYLCRIYNVINNNTIEIESIDNSNPIALYGNIFNNMYILISENIYNIENKDYIILKISEAKLLDSLNTSVNNSYTVIPLENDNKTIINTSSLPEHGITKYFNPPLGKFYWIDIEFLNYDGSPFDFRGQENMLMFVISQLNQPGKYNNILDTW